MSKGGRFVVFSGLVGLAFALTRQNATGQAPNLRSWWPWSQGQGGDDVPAGDVDLEIIGETPADQEVLDMPATGNIPRDPDLPRGVRNMNPGNLRRSGTPWQGKSAQQTDSAFVQFDSPVYGIRALARVLKTYRASYGRDTVREIIQRWAPPNENNTGAYVAAVAAEMGIQPDEEFPPTEGNMLALVRAIIQHENGMQPYSDETILRGIRLA